MSKFNKISILIDKLVSNLFYFNFWVNLVIYIGEFYNSTSKKNFQMKFAMEDKSHVVSLSGTTQSVTTAMEMLKGFQEKTIHEHIKISRPGQKEFEN